MKNQFIRYLCFLVFAGTFLINTAWSQETTVIESDLDIDESLYRDEAADFPVQEPAAEEQLPEGLDLKSEQEKEKDRYDYLLLQEQQIIQINRNLRNLIEQTGKMREEKEILEQELRGLRGQREIEATRLNAISEQRDNLQKQTEVVIKQNKLYEQKFEDLEKEYSSKEKALETRMNDLEDLLALQEKEMEEALTNPSWSPVSAADSSKTVSSREVVSMVNTFNQESEKLKKDAAKVHYNLGNTYFSQGEYERAAAEFRRSLRLISYDADAHFNLAFVSGEYLRDHESALKHYQAYLNLKPDADDALFVKEKILEATLIIQSKIQSPLNKQRTQ